LDWSTTKDGCGLQDPEDRDALQSPWAVVVRIASFTKWRALADGVNIQSSGTRTTRNPFSPSVLQQIFPQAMASVNGHISIALPMVIVLCLALLASQP
jgi:hypothetical protein